MEKYILCDNAVALFKVTRFDDFIGLNLDKRDRAVDTLQFIRDNIGVELYNNDDYNDTTDYYRISRYANKKIYEIPKVCFIDDDEEEEIGNSVEEEYNPPKSNFLKKENFIKITFIFLILIIMIFGIKNWLLQANTKASILDAVDQEQSILNEYDRIYYRINELNLNIRDELIVQKEARKIDKNSIEKVKKMESEQTDLRLQALQLSNK